MIELSPVSSALRSVGIESETSCPTSSILVSPQADEAGGEMSTGAGVSSLSTVMLGQYGLGMSTLR